MQSSFREYGIIAGRCETRTVLYRAFNRGSAEQIYEQFGGIDALTKQGFHMTMKCERTGETLTNTVVGNPSMSIASSAW